MRAHWLSSTCVPLILAVIACPPAGADLEQKTAHVPIEQPTQWTFVVNVKTAKALGLTIPESILLRADEVIR